MRTWGRKSLEALEQEQEDLSRKEEDVCTTMNSSTDEETFFEFPKTQRFGHSTVTICTVRVKEKRYVQ